MNNPRLCSTGLGTAFRHTTRQVTSKQPDTPGNEVRRLHLHEPCIDGFSVLQIRPVVCKCSAMYDLWAVTLPIALPSPYCTKPTALRARQGGYNVDQR